MDMDFAVRCPLVRCWRLLSGFCPSTRTFDPCLLRTPPRGGSPCIITRPSPPSGWSEDFHLQAAEHAQHPTKAAGAADASRGVGRDWWRWMAWRQFERKKDYCERKTTCTPLRVAIRCRRYGTSSTRHDVGDFPSASDIQVLINKDLTIQNP